MPLSHPQRGAANPVGGLNMLQSSRLLLRALELSDLNATYLGWLNDPAVNCFLETRFLPQSLEALMAYWQSHRDDSSSRWQTMGWTNHHGES